jgi:hypothetical protein
MTVTRLATRLIQAARNKSLYEFVAINLLTTCYVQTISDLLEQLVATLLASSTLLESDNNSFQTCQQLGTSSANGTSCETFTRVQEETRVPGETRGVQLEAHPFDNYVTHTFWSWSLALISKLRKVIGSRFMRARRPGQMTSLSKGCILACM